VSKENKKKEKMSVVPLSSPLSSSGNTVDVNNENDSSSVSSLLVDYTLLNSFIESNQFEKSLELYSLMLNRYLSNEKSMSLKILIKEFLEEYSHISLNELKELIESKHFYSLICSYDLIIEHYNQQYKSSSSDENSLNKVDVS